MPRPQVKLLSVNPVAKAPNGAPRALLGEFRGWWCINVLFLAADSDSRIAPKCRFLVQSLGGQVRWIQVASLRVMQEPAPDFLEAGTPYRLHYVH